MRGEKLLDAAGGDGDGVLAARRGPALERLGRLLARALEVARVAARVRLTEVAAAGTDRVDDVLGEVLLTGADWDRPPRAGS